MEIIEVFRQPCDSQLNPDNENEISIACYQLKDNSNPDAPQEHCGGLEFLRFNSNGEFQNRSTVPLVDLSRQADRQWFRRSKAVGCLMDSQRSRACVAAAAAAPCKNANSTHG